jgi:hypothetical protein
MKHKGSQQPATRPYAELVTPIHTITNYFTSIITLFLHLQLGLPNVYVTSLLLVENVCMQVE